MRYHCFRRGEIVGEIEGVKQMAAPIGQLAAAGFPEGAPTAWMNIRAVRNFFFERAVPEIPIQGFGRSFAGGVIAPGRGEIMAAFHAAEPMAICSAVIDRRAGTRRPAPATAG